MQSKTTPTNQNIKRGNVKLAKTTQPEAISKAVKRPGKKASGLLVISLVLNGLFITALIVFSVLMHMRTFWFAGKAFSAFQNTCPTQVATRLETKKGNGIETSTYYVNSAALQSGCAYFLMQSAMLDNYRAYPEQAKADADTFRNLTPDHLLNVTVVKSSENGTQLAPMQIKQ